MSPDSTRQVEDFPSPCSRLSQDSLEPFGFLGPNLLSRLEDGQVQIGILRVKRVGPMLFIRRNRGAQPLIGVRDEYYTLASANKLTTLEDTATRVRQHSCAGSSHLELESAGEIANNRDRKVHRGRFR